MSEHTDFRDFAEAEARREIEADQPPRVPDLRSLLIVNLSTNPRGIKYFMATAFMLGWLDVRPQDWPDATFAILAKFGDYWTLNKERMPYPPPEEWDRAVLAGALVAREDTLRAARGRV